MLLALAAGGVGGVTAYVRHTGHLGGTGLLVAALAHGALLLLPVDLPLPSPSQPHVEFEVATESVPAPKVEPTTPPEPDPEPEPALEPETPEPPPKPKPKPKRRRSKPAKQAPKPSTSPEPPGSPAPLRFDLSNTTTSSQSGVTVSTGKPTRPSGPLAKTGGTGNGRRTGVGNGRGPTAGAPGEPEGKGKSWNPGSPASLAALPMPLNVPEIACPATEADGVTGTVELRVQVRANGRVRKVRVTKRLGSGCDAIAKRALERAKFRPAKRMGGKPTDYEIDYEYVFSTR
ncbi:MAG: TonB family protein [Myxococcota bacterium]